MRAFPGGSSMADSKAHQAKTKGRRVLSAVEFFSGIGAFGQAARAAGIDVLAAFDQSQQANSVYNLNFARMPLPRNLDTICASQIPASDIWWMSPPCTPYTVRGRARDIDDPRSASLLKLISLIPEKMPDVIFVENVRGFGQSQACARLKEVLLACGYVFEEMDLCSRDFGTPMKRPRHFIRASLTGAFSSFALSARAPAAVDCKPLAGFLDRQAYPELLLPQNIIDRFGSCLNIVDEQDPSATVICFTAGYGKSYRAAGSILRTREGLLRRFSPSEITRLLGFPESFLWGEDLDLKARFRLSGNSVDVRAVSFLLQPLFRRGNDSSSDC